MSKKRKLEEIFYELAFWFNANLNEEELKEEFQKLKQLIENFKGKIIAESFPQLRALAYPIKKENSGYFGFLQFEVTPEKIEEIDTKVKAMPDILRFLIVKKIKTPSPSQKVNQQKVISSQKAKTELRPEKIEAVNLQELDKKLDEILKE